MHNLLRLSKNAVSYSSASVIPKRRLQAPGRVVPNAKSPTIEARLAAALRIRTSIKSRGLAAVPDHEHDVGNRANHCGPDVKVHGVAVENQVEPALPRVMISNLV